MRNFAVVSLCVIFFVAVYARPEEKYTDQYDNVNVDEILQSERLRNNYFNCLKTGKKCTPDGQKLKEILPDALQTGCKKCTDVQKEQSKKVIRYMIKSQPDQFLELENLYDKAHEYRKKYADELKKEGLELPALKA